MTPPNAYRHVPNRVIVATDAQLQRPSHMRRLAIATRALGHSRRLLVNVIADTLYHFEGEIVWPDGSPYEIPEIDEVFRNDPAFRWVSSFLSFAEEPPRQAAQARVIERLRMIDLYFRIEHPGIARSIAQ